MQRKVKKYLEDILESSIAIERMTAEKNLEEFIKDDVISSAVMWKCELIGEAMKRVTNHDLTIADSIAKTRQIIQFRNRLIHGYDTIDYETVWAIIKRDIPRLRQEVETLLNIQA